jgi:hypothetical protein
MMTQVRELISRVECYAKKAKLKPSTASRKVFLDGGRLKDLKKGSRMFPETMEAAAERLEKLEKELEQAQ